MSERHIETQRQTARLTERDTHRQIQIDREKN